MARKPPRKPVLKPALIQDTDFMVEKTFHLASYLVLFNVSMTHKRFKRCSHTSKWFLECGGQLTLCSIWSKTHWIWSKTTPNTLGYYRLVVVTTGYKMLLNVNVGYSRLIKVLIFTKVYYRLLALNMIDRVCVCLFVCMSQNP